MKKIIMFLFVILGIVLLFIFRDKILLKVFYIREARRLTNYYNSVVDNSIELNDRYGKYLKGYKNEELDITDAINDYFSIIEKCVNYKLYNTDIRYDSYLYQGDYNKPIIHGLPDNQAKLMTELLNDEDLSDYKNGQLIEKISRKILQNKSIIHKSENLREEWYMLNDEDRRIELPYNVYLDYLCDKMNVNNSLVKILNIAIYNKDKSIYCDMKYKTNVGITKKEHILSYLYNGRVIVPDIENLFIENVVKATLTVGQHDYDEAEEARIKNSDFTPLPSSDDIAAWEKELEKIEAEKKRVFEEESRKYSK